MGINGSFKQKLPPRTVERLSKYRRLLDRYAGADGVHIHSHRLAEMLNVSPEQVRRDLMLLGLSGNQRRGYLVEALLERIGETIDSEAGNRIAIVGVGNLGRALMGFIGNSDTKMFIVAAFDIDPAKTGAEIMGVPCFHIRDIPEKFNELKIDMAVLAVPPEATRAVAEKLMQTAVRGLLNFSSVHLDLPNHIYKKDYDIITSLEEIGFFIKS